MRLHRYRVFIVGPGAREGPVALQSRFLTRRGAQRRADQLNELRTLERRALVRYEVRRS